MDKNFLILEGSDILEIFLLYQREGEHSLECSLDIALRLSETTKRLKYCRVYISDSPEGVVRTVSQVVMYYK